MTKHYEHETNNRKKNFLKRHQKKLGPHTKLSSKDEIEIRPTCYRSFSTFWDF